MKIGYLTNQYPKVSHTFIRREIAALEQGGFDVERFSVRGSPDDLADPADRAEVEKTRVILEGGKPRLVAAMSKMAARNPARFAEATRLATELAQTGERGTLVHYAYLGEACVLFDWCAKARIEHLHVHFGTNPTTVALLCRVLGGPPFSFTAHGPEEFDKGHMIRLDEKIRRAAFVVGISSFGRSQLYRYARHDHWSKIHVVRCGVDETFLSDDTPQAPENDTLVCVGRLSEQKGPLLLIDAAIELAARGVHFKLVLVGDGEMRSEVEQRIDAGGIRDRVTITGWASGERVRQELLSARALVLPSFAEGLPVVIMEALAQQRPVLSTYVAGIPELVVPDDSGWLIPAGSVPALVDGMAQVLSTSKDELHRLGAGGRRRVVESHDIAKNAATLGELFRKYSGG